MNFGRAYSNFLIECVNTKSSTTDEVNVSYDEDLTDRGGEITSHREQVVVADITTGDWRFSANKPYVGGHEASC